MTRHVGRQSFLLAVKQKMLGILNQQTCDAMVGLCGRQHERNLMSLPTTKHQLGRASNLLNVAAYYLAPLHEALVTLAAPGGGGLTCKEYESLLHLYCLLGMSDDEIDDLERAHQDSDQPGDDHYVVVKPGSSLT
jgi:hypothetical protein